MIEEYKDRCDTCHTSGTPTHARSYPKKIFGKWKYVCEQCWNEFSDNTKNNKNE